MKKTDEQIKDELYKVMERIKDLKTSLIELTEEQELELRNLEVKKMQLWSDLKDDF